MSISKNELRTKIISVLESLGFIIEGNKMMLPDGIENNKDLNRKMQKLSCDYTISQFKSKFYHIEPTLLSHFASGSDVVPERIRPILIHVSSASLESELVHYIMLQVSVPTDKARGRVREFLIKDAYTDKIMGALRVGSPLRAIESRDKWVGWDAEMRSENLQDTASGLLIVSVPPYQHLMSGKLIALVCTCNEVRDNYRDYYGSELVLLTTFSAFGRSSVYNRVKYHDELVYERLGWTRGYGTFHFNNELYPLIAEFLKSEGRWEKSMAKMSKIKEALMLLDIPSTWTIHGLRCEIFAMKMAYNFREFLLGETKVPNYIDRPFDSVCEWWRNRWMLKRASWDERYKDFNPENWRLWEPDDSSMRGVQTELKL